MDTQINRLFKIPNKLIAVTGGIASGKSTLCKRLETEGKQVFYADKIAKKVYQKESVLDYLCWIEDSSTEYDGIIIGREIKDDLSFDDLSFSVNFKKLRALAFSNDWLLEVLENLVQDHFEGEFLKEYMERRLYVPRIEEYLDIYLEHPLVYQRKLQNRFDEIILCEAPLEERVQRVIERDGCSERIARLMIQRQEEGLSENNSEMHCGKPLIWNQYPVI